MQNVVSSYLRKVLKALAFRLLKSYQRLGASTFQCFTFAPSNIWDIIVLHKHHSVSTWTFCARHPTLLGSTVINVGFDLAAVCPCVVEKICCPFAMELKLCKLNFNLLHVKHVNFTCHRWRQMGWSRKPRIMRSRVGLSLWWSPE